MHRLLAVRGEARDVAKLQKCCLRRARSWFDACLGNATAAVPPGKRGRLWTTVAEQLNHLCFRVEYLNLTQVTEFWQ